MDERTVPPPRPNIEQPKSEPEPSVAAQEGEGKVAQPLNPQKKKQTLRLVLLVVGAVVSFIGATVCGYFLFG